MSNNYLDSDQKALIDAMKDHTEALNRHAKALEDYVRNDKTNNYLGK